MYGSRERKQVVRFGINSHLAGKAGSQQSGKLKDQPKIAAINNNTGSQAVKQIKKEFNPIQSQKSDFAKAPDNQSSKSGFSKAQLEQESWNSKDERRANTQQNEDEFDHLEFPNDESKIKSEQQ